MRRRRKLFCCLYTAIAITAGLGLLYILKSFEVSYFLGIQIRPALNVYDNDYLEECKTLDVALVVGGYKTTTRAVTMLKSLFYYYSDPIRLHLIVDDEAYSVFNTLFQTWELSTVSHHFYNFSTFENRVSWIPNKHYSSNYGLMKLILPEILPMDVERILFLDTDVLIVNNIKSIVDEMDRMGTRVFAMSENLSKWYTTRDPINHVWPAIGKGFNSGVMLINLKKLRTMDWTFVWRSVADEQLKIYGATMLADQDILNAVFERQPSLVYKLSCGFNVQMGINSQPEFCDVTIKNIKIVHWNSPLKTSTKNRYALFFRRHFRKFSEMDGNLLRNEQRCVTETKSKSLSNVYEYDDNADGCAEFSHAKDIKYRTLLFIKPFQLKDSHSLVTLVTQLSLDRLPMLAKIAEVWKGPISVSIYLSDSDFTQLDDYFTQSSVFAQRKNIGIHAVFKQSTFYPINYLRNVAVKAAKTKLVFLSDVDFLPSTGLYDNLNERVMNMREATEALVVPAFEYIGNSLPSVDISKQTLLSMVDEQQVQIFRQHTWPQGHGATDYDRWRTENETYQVSWQPDYEPYIVISKEFTPFYDERFVGFGWNKVTHIMKLHRVGFTFTVLPDGFCLHLPHSPSFEITRYRTSQVYRKCMKMLKGEFVRDLLLKLD